MSEVSAAPTAFAFVSPATAAARGLVEGALVTVAAVAAATKAGAGGAGAAAGAAAGAMEGAGTGAAAAGLGVADDSHGVVLRLVFVKGSSVAPADGHVVLTPWLRERLGVVQGSRVTLIQLAVPNDCSAPLLRLRPTASSESATPAAMAATPAAALAAPAAAAAGTPAAPAVAAAAPVPSGANGAVDEPESSAAAAAAGHRTPLSTLAALGRPHRLALGIVPDDEGDANSSYNMTAEDADGAARSLLARWVATQAKFCPGGSSSGGEVPVASGTVLHFKLREEGSEEEVAATFELDVLTTGGVAMLYPEQFEVSDAVNADNAEDAEDADDNVTDSSGGGGKWDGNGGGGPRVELGPPLLRLPFDPGITSKLYGRAVTVDPPLAAIPALADAAPAGRGVAENKHL